MASVPAFRDAQKEWVSIESGARPAYVGIHGGTAPLSLLRASNGLLFAFTGQTGNDFMHVLRGNATTPSVQGKTSAPASQQESPATDSAGNLSPSSPSAHAEIRESLPGKEESSPSSRTPGTVSEEARALSESAGETAPPPALADAHREAGASAEPSESGNTGTQSSSASEAPAEAPASPAPSASGGNVQAKAEMPPAVEAVLAERPADGSSLIFVSGKLAYAMMASNAFVPFGLPLPGEVADGDLGAGNRKSRFMPLKLRDYRSVLRYAGRV